MTESTRKTVAVVGTRNWLHVAAGLLQRAGLSARVLDVDRKWVPIRALLSKTCWSASAVHMIWGGDVAASLTLAGVLRRPIVWHWIGSDVTRYANGTGLTQTIRRRLAEGTVVAHLADSPDVADELAGLGIKATVCRLLPPTIEADTLPLPEQFRVLSYWFDDRRTFYGGDTLLAVARRMTDVEFLIAGAYGKGAPQLPNVRYLGHVQDMEPVYRDVSVFVRIPEHDSLSVMALESLARGRYVIYNKDFPTCHRADTLEQVCTALEETRARTVPNVDGTSFVRARFSLQTEADTLARVYSGI